MDDCFFSTVPQAENMNLRQAIYNQSFVDLRYPATMVRTQSDLVDMTLCWEKYGDQMQLLWRMDSMEAEGYVEAMCQDAR